MALLFAKENIASQTKHRFIYVWISVSDGKWPFYEVQAGLELAIHYS